MILKKEIKNGSFDVLRLDNHQNVFTLKLMEWETNFFDKRFASLKINSKQLSDIPISTLSNHIDSLLLYSDEKRYDLIELTLDSTGLPIIPLFEGKGFRLVDTRLSFITLIRKHQIEKHVPKIGDFSFATQDMKETLLKLTYKSFTDNPSFFSRFKNKLYFTPEETERYYSAWIENHLEDKETLFAVLKDKNIIIGYLIYKYSGCYRKKPIYQGVLGAGDRDYRGMNAHLALQSFVYNKFPEDEFYLHTRTQVTNITTINNYIKSKKKLFSVEFIFYRSLPD